MSIYSLKAILFSRWLGVINGCIGLVLFLPGIFHEASTILEKEAAAGKGITAEGVDNRGFDSSAEAGCNKLQEKDEKCLEGQNELKELEAFPNEEHNYAMPHWLGTFTCVYNFFAFYITSTILDT